MVGCISRTFYGWCRVTILDEPSAHTEPDSEPSKGRPSHTELESTKAKDIGFADGQPTEILIKEASARRRKRWLNSISLVVIVVGVSYLLAAPRGNGPGTSANVSGEPKSEASAGTAGPQSSPGTGTPPATITNTSLTSVSCPAEGFCVATGDGQLGTPITVGKNPSAPGNGGVGLLLTSHDLGQTWSWVSLPTEIVALTSVSCWSPVDCMSVGSSTAPAIPSSISGNNRARPTATNTQSATGNRTATNTQTSPKPQSKSVNQPQSQVQASAIVTHDAGSSWRLASLPAGLPPATEVSCFGSGNCVVLTGGDQGAQGERTQDGGRSWKPVSFPSPGMPSPRALSCSAEGLCMASGYRAPSAASNSGDQTSLEQTVVFSSQDHGASWHQVNAPQAPPSGLGQPQAIAPTSIWCAGTEYCVAAGIPESDTLNSFAVYTTDAGESWARAPGWGNNNFSDGAIAHIDCTRFPQCFGESQSASSVSVSMFFRSSDGGRSWVPVPSTFSSPNNSPSEGMGALQADYLAWGLRSGGSLACNDVSSCVVVGGGFNQWMFSATTTNGGSSWASSQIPTETTSINDLSCWGNNACIAMSTTSLGTGSELLSSNNGNSWEQIDPQSEGSVTNISQSSYLSCTPTGQCMAFGSQYLTGLGLLSATTDGGFHWANRNIPKLDQVTGLACPLVNECLIAGYFVANRNSSNQVPVGYLALTHDLGASWEQVELPKGTPPVISLSCNRTRCLLVAELDPTNLALPSLSPGQLQQELTMSINGGGGPLERDAGKVTLISLENIAATPQVHSTRVDGITDPTSHYGGAYPAIDGLVSCSEDGGCFAGPFAITDSKTFDSYELLSWQGTNAPPQDTQLGRFAGPVAPFLACQGSRTEECLFAATGGLGEGLSGLFVASPSEKRVSSFHLPGWAENFSKFSVTNIVCAGNEHCLVSGSDDGVPLVFRTGTSNVLNVVGSFPPSLYNSSYPNSLPSVP